MQDNMFPNSLIKTMPKKNHTDSGIQMNQFNTK